MRHRYATPTNAALIALAIRLQWIVLTMECTDRQATFPQNQ
jgi:hypothetical protein